VIHEPSTQEPSAKDIIIEAPSETVQVSEEQFYADPNKLAEALQQKALPGNDLARAQNQGQEDADKQWVDWWEAASDEER